MEAHLRPPAGFSRLSRLAGCDRRLQRKSQEFVVANVLFMPARARPAQNVALALYKAAAHRPVVRSINRFAWLLNTRNWSPITLACRFSTGFSCLPHGLMLWAQLRGQLGAVLAQAPIGTGRARVRCTSRRGFSVRSYIHIYLCAVLHDLDF